MLRKSFNQLRRALVLVIMVSLISGVQTIFAQGDVAEQHRLVLQQIYTDALGKGDVDLLDEHYAAGYVNHGFGEDIDLGGYKTFVNAWVSAMPDFTVTPEVIIANADDEWAASRVIFSGTFSDTFMLGGQEIAPNNKPVQVSFNTLHRFDEAGNIVEDFTAFDRLSMLLQMDATPKLPDLVAYTLVTGTIEPIVPGDAVSEGMEEAHKTGYAGVIDDSLNKGDLSAIDKYMAEDYLTHEPFGNFTRDTFKKVVTLFRQVVPDLHVAMEITVAEGDWLAGRLVYTGTFSVPLSQDETTIAATGKPITFVINVFVRFNAEGIGIADYKEYNRLGWLQQLGLVDPNA